MSLLEYQSDHKKVLIDVLKTHQTALDTSDTGTGKTYVACSIIKDLGLNPIIICPKSVLSNWHRVLQEFNVNPLGISNYESMRSGNWLTLMGKTKCPYYDHQTHQWSNLPSKTIFIFDEVHCCKNKDTLNSKLLMSTHPSKTNSQVLMLSATVADKIEYFAVVSYMIGFAKTVDLYDMQLRLYRKSNPDVSDIDILQAYTFPEHGSRIHMSSIKDMPDNVVLPEVYDLDDAKKKELVDCYDILNQSKAHRLEQKKESTNKMERIIRARQHIELCKVPIITEMAKDLVDEGMSVVIFVNFKDTLDLISAELGVRCQIKGGQSTAERDRNIRLFQENKEKIIICMIQSGGVGVSLHDTNGGFPRVSLISPPWSAQELVQALGRIARAEGKSKCLQKIIYCSGCVEEKIKAVLDKKIKIYHSFNN